VSSSPLISFGCQLTYQASDSDADVCAVVTSNAVGSREYGCGIQQETTAVMSEVWTLEANGMGNHPFGHRRR
jgi:hypothetical protein